MVGFVQGDLTDTNSWTPANIEAVSLALATEAGLAGKDATAAMIEEGRGLVADGERCGSCHRFGKNDTEPGGAPDLTGWGSREWLVGIISDPTHERFYGESNDRMPSFGGNAAGAAAALSRRQIELVADWLRGDWYRPAAGH
jgi:ubiquinol-cytochrome c reductase cytochrome b subunit